MVKKRAPIEEVRDWEVIQATYSIERDGDNDTDKTERLAVLGGWLYRVISATGVALTYVPGKKR